MSARRVLTVADPSCQVVIFMRADGSAEALVVKPAKDPIKGFVVGTLLTRVEIAKPPEGFSIVVARLPDGSAEVVYSDE
jgi:hypothetical protein